VLLNGSIRGSHASWEKSQEQALTYGCYEEEHPKGYTVNRLVAGRGGASGEQRKGEK